MATRDIKGKCAETPGYRKNTTFNQGVMGSNPIALTREIKTLARIFGGVASGKCGSEAARVDVCPFGGGWCRACSAANSQHVVVERKPLVI
jgi:hypothetical protein